MNENLKKYAIPIIVGVVVLYLIFRTTKGSTSSTSTINRLIPIGESNTQTVNRDQARVAAFSSLSQVAGQQISYEADKQRNLTRLQGDQLSLEGLKYSLLSGQEVERIKAGLQRELGLQQLEGLIRQIAGQEEVYRINSADRRYDTDAQLMAIDRMNTAQMNLYNAQSENAFRTLMAQIEAVGQVGQQYRSQSLEGQGTILNALSAIWGQPRVYDYQSAFGGPRSVPILQQITGLIGQLRWW